jgi:dGTPase
MKAIAAHYVMRTDVRRAIQSRQRELLHELADALWRRPDVLERPFADDWAEATDDAQRKRVLIDQIASLTDPAAVAWHGRLVGGPRG